MTMAPTALLPYTPPPWGGTPTGVPYTLEVVKHGVVINSLPLESLSVQTGRPFITLGRAPSNDIVLDHPSCSRLHVVIQFRGEDGAAFLFDPGSTHGTFLNKQRIAPEKYHAFQVGDHLKMGESSRTYILGGPAQLMPEQGPSREQRRQDKAAFEIIKAREAKRAKMNERKEEQGVTWGIHDYDDDDDDDDGKGGDGLDDIDDWREMVDGSRVKLSDKQQKMVEKIRAKEIKIRNWQIEIDRIEAKERDGLSCGQQNALFRNRQAIDLATEELEELEETLIESLRARKGMKRKQPKLQHEEGVDDSEDEDFYDRTNVVRRKRKVTTSEFQQDQQVEDAPSLLAKLRALVKERQTETSLLVALEKPSPQSTAKSTPTEKVTPRGSEEENSNPTDELDAFMVDIATDLEKDSVRHRRENLKKIEAQIAETKRLLALADPEGYYGTVAE